MKMVRECIIYFATFCIHTYTSWCNIAYYLHSVECVTHMKIIDIIGKDLEGIIEL